MSSGWEVEGQGQGQGVGRPGSPKAVPTNPWDSFPERPGRLGAAASTANLLDDVEGHAYGKVERAGRLEL